MRKRFSNEFKAKVALAALKGDRAAGDKNKLIELKRSSYYYKPAQS